MLNGPDESKATEVVVIRNMMSDDDLANDDECKDIAEGQCVPVPLSDLRLCCLPDTISKCEEEYGKVNLHRHIFTRPEPVVSGCAIRHREARA